MARKASPDEVHARYFDQPEVGVFLTAQNRACRLGDFLGLQTRGCDLIEQWLEEVVVVAIDENDLHGRPPQCAGNAEAAEAGANDDDGGDGVSP